MGDKKLPTKVFGEVLQELRLEQGLTQDQLAELPSTERSHISALARVKGDRIDLLSSISLKKRCQSHS